MHGFWAEQFDVFHRRAEELKEKKCSISSVNDRVGKAFEQNRYYMPTYLDWLRRKLPSLPSEVIYAMGILRVIMRTMPIAYQSHWVRVSPTQIDKCHRGAFL